MAARGMKHLFGYPFSFPDDAPRWFAVVFAGVALWVLPRVLRLERVPRAVTFGAPVCAALLSAVYVVHYLRGGPRIIDATAYFLQARALSQGLFAFPLPEPEHAVLGRFLVRTTLEGAPAAAVIFPPGYPAALALGFLVGAPMAVGPLIAAALTAATMALARALAERLVPERVVPVVVTAAALSVFSPALRYHTADTMSHGLAALAVTTALWAALRGAAQLERADGSEHGHARRYAAVAGFALGLLFATRPASALALGVALALLAAAAPAAWPRRLALAAIALAAAAPPLVLWALHQRAATGSPIATAQDLYYATSDGPAGCFRYGFGAGIGCRGEHGTFVADNLADGYGWVAAVKTTARRLQLHQSDALGFAPSFVAVVAGALRAVRDRRTLALALMIPALWLAYAPFYFDGNYPGGGARMFADVIPVEQVLAAVAVIAAAHHRAAGFVPWAGAGLVALELLGFAFHGGSQHRLLAERDGGRPMFEAPIVASALAEGEPGLVFVDTDHGFNLAYDPARPTVARFHGDDLDTLAWQGRGQPPAFRYRYDFESGGGSLEPIELAARDELRIEAESLWPPLAQPGGWAWPRHVADDCASRGKVLWLEPSGAAQAVTLRLPRAAAGHQLRAIALLAPGDQLVIHARADEQPIGTRTISGGSPAGCLPLGPIDLPAGASELTLELAASGPIGLDVLVLRKNH
jgi:hypothetical protein